jgi:phage-related protein
VTHPIDTAYVDIVPVDKSLEKLQRDIDRAMKKIDKEAEKDLKNIDKEFDQTFKKIDKHMQDMEDSAERHFKELDDIVENSLGDVLGDFDDAFNDIDRHFSRTSDSSDRSFKRIRNRFLEPLADGLQKAGSTLSDLGRAMIQLVSGVGGAIGSNPMAALIVVLIPPIIALAAALSQLIGLVGLLPAGLSVLLAAILPVVVAFQGFGEAVSALASGDIDKINEAMKRLSPSAASVAREVGALMPMLKSFQRVVQEAFFSQIRGDFTNVVRTLFPLMEKGFVTVASAMGKLVSSFADLLTKANSMQVFREIFATTGRIIEKLTPSFVMFADMLLSTVHEALPFVERIAVAFGKALDAFSAFVNKSIEAGDFDEFIEDAITTVKELIDLTKALGAVLGTLFAGTEESGHDFIKTLTDLILKLDAFLKTAEGQDAIKALVISVKILGSTLFAVLQILETFWRIFLTSIGFLDKVGKGFVALVVIIGNWLGKIPDIVTEFIGSIPEMVAGFLQSMIDRALQVLGIGIGLILFMVFELPKQIIAAIENLPQQIYNALVSIGPIVVGIFSDAMTAAKDFVVNGFNEIMAFITSVPDRIKGLIPNFSSAGHNLIESFMNGFRSVGSFIGDIAGDIVNSVKGFLNKAIDKINSGIAMVDNVLPGDLGRIPRLAEGALVHKRPGGILANIGEGSEDEVVAPLSKLEGLLGGGPTITFGPGSVSVNFSGVVPTMEEARQVGTAVGEGIVNLISRRNTRAAVRAI